MGKLGWGLGSGPGQSFLGFKDGAASTWVCLSLAPGRKGKNLLRVGERALPLKASPLPSTPKRLRTTSPGRPRAKAHARWGVLASAH